MYQPPSFQHHLWLSFILCLKYDQVMQLITSWRIKLSEWTIKRNVFFRNHDYDVNEYFLFEQLNGWLQHNINLQKTKKSVIKSVILSLWFSRFYRHYFCISFFNNSILDFFLMPIFYLKCNMRWRQTTAAFGCVDGWKLNSGWFVVCWCWLCGWN